MQRWRIVPQPAMHLAYRFGTRESEDEAAVAENPEINNEDLE